MTEIPRRESPGAVRGGDCSFETILCRHDPTDPVLGRIAVSVT